MRRWIGLAQRNPPLFVSSEAKEVGYAYGLPTLRIYFLC
jgi:hypothetical protein